MICEFACFQYLGGLIFQKVLLCVFLPACDTKRAVISRISIPEATITSHTGTSQFQEGYEVILQGIVTDANHNALDL